MQSDLDSAPAARGETLPGARLSLALLLGINLFNYIDRYILAATEPRIHDAFFGSSDSESLAKMGSLVTVFTISYMIAAPIFGFLADRMSRWLMVGVAVLLWSLASGGSGLASSFGFLMLTRMFIGIGEAGYGPAAPTIISDMFPVERRGQALAWFYLAIPVGSAIGYIWGGLVADWINWRWAFYTVVPPGLILGMLCFGRRDPRAWMASRPDAVRPKRASLDDYLSLLRNRSYVLDCAGMTAMTFAIGGISFWMPHYLAEYRNVGSLKEVNSIFGAIVVIAGSSATLVGGIVGDRLRGRFSGSYFIVSGAGILIACPFVILMLFVGGVWMWASIAVAVFFLFFNTGPSNTILANVTHSSVRSTAFALNIFLIHILGDAISPPILGKIVGAGKNWNAAFIVVAVIMALAAVLWLIGTPYLQADTKRASGEA